LFLKIITSNYKLIQFKGSMKTKGLKNQIQIIGLCSHKVFKDKIDSKIILTNSLIHNR
jgi:hypothetical protein